MVTTLLFVLAVTLAVRSHGRLFPDKKDIVEKGESCNSKQCEERAKVILSYIDQTQDPCEDFYLYACGKHLNSSGKGHVSDLLSKMEDENVETMNDIFGSLPNITRVTNATEAVILMFQTCMDGQLSEEEEIQAIKLLLQKKGYGDWPLLGNEKNTNKRFKTLSDYLLSTELDDLFLVNADPDPASRTTSIITLGTSMPTVLAIADSRLQDDPEEGIRPWIESQEEVLMTAAARFRSNATKDIVTSLAREVLHFKKDWRKAEVSRVRTKPYWRARIGEVEVSVPGFPLLNVLNGYFKNMNLNLTLSDEDNILITHPELFNDTLQFLLKQDVNDIYNYMGMHLVLRYLYVSSTSFREERERIFEKHGLDLRKYHPMERCTHIIHGAPPLATRLYINEKFDVKVRHHARSLLNKIGAMFYENLQFSPWMDQATRRGAINKLWNMRPLVGFSDTLMNTTIIDTIRVNPENFRRNASASLMYYLFHKMFREKLLSSKLLRTEIFVEEYHYERVNGYYNPPTNEMVILAGILRGIFFQQDLPMYLNLGAIGFIMGHEITHGFDNTGSPYEDGGRMLNWWSNYTFQIFEQKANCFLEQYTSIVDPVANLSLNGKRTLRENIADNGGIKMAFRALRSLEQHTQSLTLPLLENFTPDQLFFISFAIPWCLTQGPFMNRVTISRDLHAPSKYRVNVPLKNMEEFSAAFHCKKGSPMRLTDRERCVLW